MFGGPSLYGLNGPAVLRADYRPPVRRGDVYRLIATGVSTIALIDGVFHNEPSVWHRELLEAIHSGIRVIGAASMGALRAAELQGLGMEGHGTVFRWYRDGIVTRDDEVAVQHAGAADGYRMLSEPLVNIRATLSRLRKLGVIDDAESRCLVDFSAALYYPQRSLMGLLESSLCRGWPVSRRERVATELQVNRCDIKRADARSLLFALVETEQVHSEFLSVAPVGRLEYRRAALAARTICGHKGDDLLTRLDERPAHLAQYRRAALASWLLAGWANDSGVRWDGDVADERQKWMSSMAIKDLGAWLIRQGLSLPELDEHLGREALRDQLTRQGPDYFGISSYLHSWADARGLKAPTGCDMTDWILDTEPARFGYRCDASVELLRSLQCKDQVCLIFGECPPRAT